MDHGGPWGQGYFPNNTKASFAIFVVLTFSPILRVAEVETAGMTEGTKAVGPGGPRSPCIPDHHTLTVKTNTPVFPKDVLNEAVNLINFTRSEPSSADVSKILCEHTQPFCKPKYVRVTVWTGSWTSCFFSTWKNDR